MNADASGGVLLAAAVFIASLAVARIIKVHAERHAPPVVELWATDRRAFGVARGLTYDYQCVVCRLDVRRQFRDDVRSFALEVIDTRPRTCSRCASTLVAHDWTPKDEGASA